MQSSFHTVGLDTVGLDAEATSKGLYAVPWHQSCTISRPSRQTARLTATDENLITTAVSRIDPPMSGVSLPPTSQTASHSTPKHGDAAPASNTTPSAYDTVAVNTPTEHTTTTDAIATPSYSYNDHSSKPAQRRSSPFQTPTVMCWRCCSCGRGAWHSPRLRYCQFCNHRRCSDCPIKYYEPQLECGEDSGGEH